MDAEMSSGIQSSSEEASCHKIGSKDDVCENGTFYRLAQSPTHDTSLIGEHATIRQLGEDLESAVKAGWPRAPGTRYTNVKALLLSWEDDDLGVMREIKRLRCVLENKYDYHTQTFEIPSRKPDIALKGKVVEFLAEDDENTLLILYYGGHARRGNQMEGPLWFANRKTSSNAILSSGIQSSFEQADADVLLLYDCCHSAAMTTGCHQSNTSVTEVIAACAFETFAAEVDEHSFTNALINTLALASSGPPFSVAELSSRVLSRLRSWTPSLLIDDDGNNKKDANGEYIFERQPRRTPIYNILCESKNRRSIILTPRTYSNLNSTPPPSSLCPSPYVGVDTPGSKKRKISVEEQIQWPQIILSIRLDSAQLEIDTWREYIRSLPAEAQDIKIEGVWKSFSTLLIVRMPVTIWNLLPDHGAYSFVGFVTSENLAFNNRQSGYNGDICQREEDFEGSSSDTPHGSDGRGETFRDADGSWDAGEGDMPVYEHREMDPELLSRLNLGTSTTESTSAPSIFSMATIDTQSSIAEMPQIDEQVQETSASDIKTSMVPGVPRPTASTPSISSPWIPSVAQKSSNPQSIRKDNPTSSRGALMNLGAKFATSAASRLRPDRRPDGLSTSYSRRHGHEVDWIWTCCSCGLQGDNIHVMEDFCKMPNWSPIQPRHDMLDQPHISSPTAVLLASLLLNNDNAAMNGSTITSTVLEAPAHGGRPGENDDIFKDGFIRLPPRTHDISFTDSHISSIERLGADLDAAVKAVWPKRHGIKYSQAHVLLLSWQADELGVEAEIEGLGHVFRDRFNFQVETYQIPSLKPDKALKRRVLDFLDFDGKDTLLVVYYGGHARRGLHSTDSPIWFANRDNLAISLPSGGIQSMLEEADSDVLLLFDCCHSAAVATKDSLQGNGGVTEVIAACGYETIAAAVDEHSFTKSLTETLAVASKGLPFSVGELHSRVLRKLKCWTPCPERAIDGRFIDEPDGRLRLEHQPRRTPIYSIVSESVPRRSIVLAPLPQLASSPKGSSDSDFESSGSSPGASTPSQSDSNTGSSCGKRKRPIPDDGPCAQILLAIRVDRDVDIPAFTEWIRNCPAQGREIHIEGKYDSFSTLLILRIPVAVWSLIPDNPAYTFVGFVTSGNRESASADNTTCGCTSTRRCYMCEKGVHSGLVGSGDSNDANPISGEDANYIENRDFLGRKKFKGKEKGYAEQDQATGRLRSMTSQRQKNQRPVHDKPTEPADNVLSEGDDLTFSASSSVMRDPNLPRNVDTPSTWIDNFKTMSIRRIIPEWLARTVMLETGSALSNPTPGKESSAAIEDEIPEQSNSNLAVGTILDSAAGMNGPKRTNSHDSSEETDKRPTDHGKTVQSSNVSPVTPHAPVINQRCQSPHLGKKRRTTKHSHKSHEHKYDYIWIWNCCSCGHGGMTTGVEQCPGPGYQCGHTRCTYCSTEAHQIRKSR